MPEIKCKYYKQKKQVSYDNGVNWEDVIPYEYQKGPLYERDSECHVPPTPTSAVTITWSGLPGGITSGGLLLTGSTYTADFILGGPNAGNGTLYGTLTADPRASMAFTGQFTTSSGGGNLVNACGTQTGEIYAVTAATWNVSTNTLSVVFSKCASPTPSTCSVSFSVNNNTSTEVNGSVKIFWGLDQSRSFTINVGRLTPGMTNISTITLGSSTTAGACGQTINTAQFESTSYNTPMNINGSRMLNDGSTIYLTFPT